MTLLRRLCHSVQPVPETETLQALTGRYLSPEVRGTVCCIFLLLVGERSGIPMGQKLRG